MPEPATDQQTQPTIADSNPILVWTFELDGVGQGDIVVYADALGYATNTDWTINRVYVAHNGELHKVEQKVECSPYDDQDVAAAVVTLTLPDGSTLTGSYTVEGRV